MPLTYRLEIALGVAALMASLLSFLLISVAWPVGPRRDLLRAVAILVAVVAIAVVVHGLFRLALRRFLPLVIVLIPLLAAIVLAPPLLARRAAERRARGDPHWRTPIVIGVAVLLPLVVLLAALVLVVSR